MEKNTKNPENREILKIRQQLQWLYLSFCVDCIANEKLFIFSLIKYKGVIVLI